MITSQTRLLAVLGDPVHHSLSPLMHNAAFAHARLDACYVALPTPAAHLGDVLTALWHTQWLGLNITLPHKQRVMKYLAELTPAAQAIGAVNTLYRGTSGWCGANTDGVGFLQPLVDWSGKRPWSWVMGARRGRWSGVYANGAVKPFTSLAATPSRPSPAGCHPSLVGLGVLSAPGGFIGQHHAPRDGPPQHRQPPNSGATGAIADPRLGVRPDLHAPAYAITALGSRTRFAHPRRPGDAGGAGAAAWGYWFGQEAPITVMTQALEQFLAQSIPARAPSGPTNDTQGCRK